VRLESVGVRYGRRGAWVLDAVTLDLEPGTVTAVTGGNGSGKSTLLKVASGLVRPTRGTVRRRPARVGYVPERLPSHARLSARSYLLHMGRVQGLTTATARTRATEILGRLGLEGDPGAPISTLSKGNAQKVALAQALLAGPGLLVLDEPWSGLDTRAHDALAACLDEQRAAGVIVLLTEHRPETVARTADTTHHLRGGRLTAGTRPVCGTTAHMLVALRLAGPARHDPAAEARAVAVLPGVVTAGHDADGVRLRVAAGHCDDLLREALRRGHSVLEVRREAAAPPPPAPVPRPHETEDSHP
jgi:ABC-2 type transport system ATP-binding protein